MAGEKILTGNALAGLHQRTQQTFHEPHELGHVKPDQIDEAGNPVIGPDGKPEIEPADRLVLRSAFSAGSEGLAASVNALYFAKLRPGLSAVGQVGVTNELGSRFPLHGMQSARLGLLSQREAGYFLVGVEGRNVSGESGEHALGGRLRLEAGFGLAVYDPTYIAIEAGGASHTTNYDGDDRHGHFVGALELGTRNLDFEAVARAEMDEVGHDRSLVGATYYLATDRTHWGGVDVKLGVTGGIGHEQVTLMGDNGPTTRRDERFFRGEAGLSGILMGSKESGLQLRLDVVGMTVPDPDGIKPGMRAELGLSWSF